VPVIVTTADDPRAAESQRLLAEMSDICQEHKNVVVFEAVLNFLLLMIRDTADEWKPTLFSSIKQAVALAENETDTPVH
jgi:hypothetical protein